MPNLKIESYGLTLESDTLENMRALVALAKENPDLFPASETADDEENETAESARIVRGGKGPFETLYNEKVGRLKAAGHESGTREEIARARLLSMGLIEKETAEGEESPAPAPLADSGEDY